jgi:ferric-dicitrate binding protein FerR (iron transport regulator)
VSEEDDRYLWDRSGPEDPDVARLEKLLAPLANAAPQPSPQTHDAPLADAPLPKRRSRRAPWVAASVGALALAAAIWLVVKPNPDGHRATHPPRHPPTLASACGTPTDGSYAFRVEGEKGALCDHVERRGGWVPVGGVLETPADAKATLEVAQLGTVALAPGSSVKLLPSSGNAHTLDLIKGTLHARIDAPPRLFVVKTKQADAVDLGCEYELTVDEKGEGRLAVSYGSVALERASRAPTLVTQGAWCRIGKNGAGTPLSNGASAEMKKAAADLDEGDGTAFDRILRAADEQDTLTLWHVMRRLDPEERGRAYDRLAKIVKPPANAPRAAVVAGETAAIAAYRDALKERWFHSPTW